MTDWNGKIERNLDPANIDLLRLQTEADASANRQLVEINVADLLSKPPDPVDWIWDGYVPRGMLTLWHGAGGVGKSLTVLAMLRAAISGSRFLGRDTWPVRAAYIDAENPPSE